MLEVVEPGLYSTVQDMGRPGAGHLGVRQAGAADRLALAAANVLVSNVFDAPALEMTLVGATFDVREACLVGIAGADMGARLEPEGRSLPVGGSYWLEAGRRLVFGPAVDGARCYVGLAGGIAAAFVLGSASTDPTAGFGGVDGRTVRKGDLLAATRPERRPQRTWPPDVASSGVVAGTGAGVLAVIPGPHHDRLSEAGARQFVSQAWTVTARSDRVGLRLEGTPIPSTPAAALVSQPMVPGAVQLPPGGSPIVLMPDAPSIGGYPVPAVIAEVDRPACGQLRPGDEVRFEWRDLETARAQALSLDARVTALADMPW